ncbi:Holliday junction branch migration protein RuvA [Xylanimonas allomyrinae]|uniref:Holliday junction branch migration complex subunit RuvA n=1 Tax=Xylanimonas allomyrinae TaxID=2509459 RepID=A0A4P6EQZ9_9MICO|nr:Holliday junction branch migration protein RuvA [Xylanimonas allomyrinae]QAY62747.1 Holliday junction branch migration protein RuvA [Xylanimonas allomyrinae]
MIASLTGIVERVSLDRAVINVQGVGYLVHATPGTLARLRIGEASMLYTTMVVREESMTLYAFADDDERDVFETAQSVSGVGPRIALAILAVHTPDAVRAAMHTQDVKALTRVPGIGPKVAQRILLELGGKLGAPTGAGNGATAGSPAAAGDQRGKVVEALVGLGYPSKVAEDAVARALKDSGAETVAEPDVAATLRATLRSLGGRRG